METRSEEMMTVRAEEGVAEEGEVRAEEGAEEVREVEEEEWKAAVDAVEWKEDVVERGNTRGNPEMPELESRLKTSVEVVERETGEPSKMMPRKEMRPPTTPPLRKPHLLRVKQLLLLLREKLSRRKVLRTRSLLRRK